MPDPVIQRSFAGGELAPALHARADTAKYATGLKLCKNFFVRREGGVSNRAGTRFTEACKDNVAGKRLMRYIDSSPNTGVLIEIGSGYFRFFFNGEPVTVSAVPAWSAVVNYVPGDLVVQGGVNYYAHTASLNQVPPNASFWYPLTGNIYEIPTPYSSSAIFQWNQSGNVIRLTEPGQAPRDLIFVNLTRWVLQQVTTAPGISAPTGGAGVAGAAGARTYAYMVTAARIETYEESNPSAVITIVGCAEPTAAAPNALSWTPVVGAAEYYVYADPFVNGVFGFVGTAQTNIFNDAGFIPDFAVTPPLPRALFNSANNFPVTSAQFQQRRFFANTNTDPDGVWGSRIGFPNNFGISSPLQDDDAVTFKLAGNNHHAVRRMIALKAGLILFTDGGEWTLTGAGGAKVPITPSSIDSEQETYVGIKSSVPPVVIGNTVIYAQARGQTMNEIRFAQEVEGLAGKDLSIYASHLTAVNKTVVAMDYQREPDSIVWVCRSDGALLGLTYVPEQEVWGWHQHQTLDCLPAAATSTPGLFEDVCVVPEGNEDVVYFIVSRLIGGATVRYIERLESRQIREGFFNADCFFVDSGLSYSGPPADSFSGLGHLNGQVVAVVGDGTVVFNGDPNAANAADFTVTAGVIETAALYSQVHIGLPIRYADLELLDLDTSGSAIRDKKKKVTAVTLLVERSSRGFLAGPDTASLRQYLPDVWETGAEHTGQLELNTTGTFNETGRVFIRQSDPLPITILGAIPLVELGG